MAFGTFLFHMEPPFFFKSVMPAGCWAAKSTMPSVVHEQSVPLFSPTPNQLLIYTELALRGTIARVLGKMFHLALEVGCVALPT